MLHGRFLATLRVAALGIAGLLALPAEASPGWSSKPRWRLPASGPRRVRRAERRAAQPVPAPAPTRGSSKPSPPEPSTRDEASGLPRRTAAPKPRRPDPVVADLLDATEVMDLTPGQCGRVLRQARVPFDRLPARAAPGVDQPVRVTGPIHGVRFSIPWSKDLRNDEHAIWDCRLVAAMIPLADWLFAHGIGEVHYFSVLRKRSSRKKKRRSQHNFGLAIDVLGLVPRSGFPPGDPRAGSRWDVEVHYPKGRVHSCPAPDFRDQRTDVYAQFVCFATKHGLFHTLLTPDYDHAHRNHLHLDLKAGQTRPADPYVSFSD